jgi:hypothetical protein
MRRCRRRDFAAEGADLLTGEFEGAFHETSLLARDEFADGDEEFLATEDRAISSGDE